MRNEQSEITQPQNSEPQVTREVAAETPEIAIRDYRAALLRDPRVVDRDEERLKRRYVKSADKELRSNTFTTRSGRDSRPPTRF